MVDRIKRTSCTRMDAVDFNKMLLRGGEDRYFKEKKNKLR